MFEMENGRWIKSGDLLRSVIDKIGVGLMVIGPRMELLFTNKQMHSWYPGIDLEKRSLCYQAIGQSSRSSLCPGCPTCLTLKNGGVHEAVMEKYVGGNPRQFRVVSSPFSDKNGEVVAAIESIEDVTERYHVQEQIRNLTRKLISAQETERWMISRELHDNLAQEMAAARMICDNLAGGQGALGSPIQESLKKIGNILTGCIVDIRRLSYDLRPPGLKQIGLVDTLQRYVDDFSETFQISVDFRTAGMEKLQPTDELSINLYRLIQEGLNNVRKHAGASRVLITLILAPPNLMLRIEDNGVGFDVARRQATITREKKLGLRSMQERVELLGGAMNVRSKPGAGTRIFIKLPSTGGNHGTQKNHSDR